MLDLSDRLWRGELAIEDAHPFSVIGAVEELADGVAFVPSFADVSGLRTDDGLVLVDTGSAPLAQHVHSTLRSWDSSRLHTAVYSHGHIDHVFGAGRRAAGAVRAVDDGARGLDSGAGRGVQAGPVRGRDSS